MKKRAIKSDLARIDRMRDTGIDYSVSRNVKFLSDGLNPLLRVFDAGPLLAHFTHSALTPLGSAASALARAASRPFARTRSDRQFTIERLDRFDDRADALWERARRSGAAMVKRDQRYLNWRYCQRPDATYILYGAVRDSKLEGFLVARFTTYPGHAMGLSGRFPGAGRFRCRALISD
jgi:hypothetical protein